MRDAWLVRPVFDAQVDEADHNGIPFFDASIWVTHEQRIEFVRIWLS